MKSSLRLAVLLAGLVLAAGCQAGGAELPVALTPTLAGDGTRTPSALRPATATAQPTASPATTAVEEAAKPQTDPFQDEATLLVYSQLEEDSTALREFMQSDPARRAMYGGTYIEHPTGPQLGAPDSYNVLQLVATQAEADALRAELPALIFPDRLQVELVACTDDHLNELMEQQRPALEASGIFISQYLDSKANRIALVVKPSADYTVVDGLLDKATLPPDIAAELADPCVAVAPIFEVSSVGDDPLDGTAWRLVSAPGHEATLERLSPEHAPTLTFAEGALVFTTGCNDPSGYYGVNGNELTAASGVMRLINCSGELGGADAMDLELALANAISTFSSYTLVGEELHIQYDGGELVFGYLP